MSLQYNRAGHNDCPKPREHLKVKEQENKSQLYIIENSALIVTLIKGVESDYKHNVVMLAKPDAQYCVIGKSTGTGSSGCGFGDANNSNST